MALYYNGQKVSTKSKLEIDYVLPEIDSVPTEGSENPVTSGGVYEALQNVDATVVVDQEVIAGSTNPVSGGAVADYLSMPITNFVEAKKHSINFKGKTLSVSDYSVLDLSDFPPNTSDYPGYENGIRIECLCVGFTNGKTLCFNVLGDTKKMGLVTETYEIWDNIKELPQEIIFSDDEDWIIDKFSHVYEYPENYFVEVLNETFLKAIDINISSLEISTSKYIKSTDKLYLQDMIQDDSHQTISASQKASFAANLERLNTFANQTRNALHANKRVLEADGETTFFEVPFDVIPGIEIDASQIGASVTITQKRRIEDGRTFPAYHITVKKAIEGPLDFRIALEEGYDFNGETLNFTSVVQHATSGTAYIYLGESGHYFFCKFQSTSMTFSFIDIYAGGFEYDFSNSEPQSCSIYDMSQYSGSAKVSKFVFKDVDGVSSEISAEEFYNTCAEIYFEMA